MMAVLQTIDLKKYYGEGENQIKALDGICLEIEEGKFTAIVGTSGSGKSTLLHMLGGLDTPTYGRVIVGGKDISKMSLRFSEEEGLDLYFRIIIWCRS